MRLPAAKLRVTPRETTTLRFYASAARIRQTWSFRGPGRFRFLRPEPARAAFVLGLVRDFQSLLFFRSAAMLEAQLPCFYLYLCSRGL